MSTEREHIDDVIKEFNQAFAQVTQALLDLKRLKQAGIVWFVDGEPEIPDNVVPVDFNGKRVH